MFDATIEVVDNEGNVVEVEPVDIPAGDTTVFFEFSETQTTQEGVWTIAGIEYDFDLAADLAAFEAATTQVALNKALADLGIENVVTANMPTYLDTVNFELNKTDYFAELEGDLTVEAIQTWIDEANAAIAAAGEEAEVETAAVKAVVDALDAGNDIALLEALQNDVFERVNDEWLAQYKAEFGLTSGGTVVIDDADVDTVADVQANIDYINTDEITTVLDALNNGGTFTAAADVNSVEVDDLNEAKDLIVAYAPVDSEGEYVAIATVAVDDILEQVDVQLAVANVLAATTPTTLKARLASLDALEVFSTDFMKDNYLEANLSYYLNGFGDPATGGFKQVSATNYTVTQVEGIITGMNSTVSASYVADVNAATDADELLTALKAFPGLEYVADANKDVYWATANANFDGVAVTNATTAQAAVVTQNIAAINAADKTKVIAALNVLELDDVIAANAEAYVADDSASVYTDAAPQDLATATDRDEVQAAVDQLNKAVVVAAQVKAINEAEDVATVKVALDTLADVDEVADYLKIRSVDRDFVAAYVLQERDNALTHDGEYANLAAIDGEVTAAEGAYDTALTNVNALVIGSSIDDIVSALEDTLDEDYLALSNTAKVTAAEAFYDQLVFAENGTLKTPFVTLAAVKALL